MLSKGPLPERAEGVEARDVLCFVLPDGRKGRVAPVKMQQSPRLHVRLPKAC